MVVYTLEQRACDRLTQDTDFGKKKIFFFSDEAHFDFGGYVNKQNYRIWGTENPHAPKTTYCLVQILFQIHNWAIFLRK